MDIRSTGAWLNMEEGAESEEDDTIQSHLLQVLKRFTLTLYLKILFCRQTCQYDCKFTPIIQETSGAFWWVLLELLSTE